ncbi:MAG: hypothetical protein ABFC34_04815 [Methanobacterium sp.]
MANNIADNSKNLDDEVQQKIITPLRNKVDDLDIDLTEKEETLKSLDDIIQLKLGRCQDILKKNTGTVNKYLETFGAVFVVSGLASIGIWVALGVDKSVDWIISNQSFSNTSKVIYLFGFVVLFVIVSAISVILFYHFVIRKQYENSLSEFETNSIDPEKKGIKKVFEDFKVSAKGAEGFFRSKISLVENVNAEIKSEREWYLECEKMLMIIAFFGLKKELKNTIIDLKKNPPDSSNNKPIIDYVCEKASFNSTLMNLLVSYYDGENNKVESYWSEVKKDKKLFDKIANIIWDLNIFNLYNDIEIVDKNVLSVDELKPILSKSQQFEKSLIMNNVLLYTRIYKHLLDYREKLAIEKANENINLKKQLTKNEIIENIVFSNDFVSNFIDIFSKELRKSLDIDSKDAYVGALMAIILSQDINFRETVCKNVSKNDEAIYVLMAYHDLREQKGKKNEHFSLYDIFNKDYTPCKMRDEINTDHFSKIKFKHFSTALSEGTWIESTQVMLLSMIDNVKKQLIKSEKNEIVIKIFTKYFTKININTLDRAVDAGLFTIYLILVPPTGGSFLRGVIDKLSIQKNKHITKKQNEKDNGIRSFNYNETRKSEERYDISLFFDSDKPEPQVPMYDFDNYSNATRIGIVHNQISFTTFVDRFNKDVEKVLRREIKENPSQKWEKITFILLRISPSKYSFGLMNDKTNIEGVKSFGNLDLVEKIATLASPYLTEMEKTAVATFENDIKLEKILEELALFDFMPLNTKSIYEKRYGELLESPVLMGSIKECLKTYNIESFRELSNSLFYRPKIQNELKKSLAIIIAKENIRLENPPLDEEIQEEFVSEFLTSIKSLHDMWNHEIFGL